MAGHGEPARRGTRSSRTGASDLECAMSRHRPRGDVPRNDASRRYHDRVARQYDSIYDDPYWDFHDELTWRAIKPHLPRDLSAACCDLGCGTGKWGLKLLKSGFATTFVDHAAAMIEQVRPKLDELGEAKAKKATLLVADIVDMPALPSEHFAPDAGDGRSAVDLLRSIAGRPRDASHQPPRRDRHRHRRQQARRHRSFRRARQPRRPRRVRLHQQNPLADRRRAGTLRADDVHAREPAKAVREKRLRGARPRRQADHPGAIQQASADARPRRRAIAEAGSRNWRKTPRPPRGRGICRSSHGERIKFEIRNTKYETSTKYEEENPKRPCFVLSSFEFRICFGFRISCFGFHHLTPPLSAGPSNCRVSRWALRSPARAARDTAHRALRCCTSARRGRVAKDHQTPAPDWDCASRACA